MGGEGAEVAIKAETAVESSKSTTAQAQVRARGQSSARPRLQVGCSDAGYSSQAEASGDGDGQSGVGTRARKLRCQAAGTVGRRGCCRGVPGGGTRLGIGVNNLSRGPACAAAGKGK